MSGTGQNVQGWGRAIGNVENEKKGPPLPFAQTDWPTPNVSSKIHDARPRGPEFDVLSFNKKKHTLCETKS